VIPVDPSPGAAELGDEESYEDDGPIYAEGDGPAPAASLTSIRLTRRRPRGKQRAAAAAAPQAAPQATPQSTPASRPADRPQTKPSSRASRAEPEAMPASAADQHRTASIVDYWSRLRGGRSYPSPAELDAGLIAATWPNAILLRRYDGESGLRAAALYKPEAGPAGRRDRELDLTPMVVEWILSLAERTVDSGEPLAEKETFERPGGAVRYGACTLPLSEGRVEVDHVLCYIKVLS
jgi:hypothetical protein